MGKADDEGDDGDSKGGMVGELVKALRAVSRQVEGGLDFGDSDEEPGVAILKSKRATYRKLAQKRPGAITERALAHMLEHI